MDKQKQIELEALAVMLGIGGYRGSSYTLQEEVRFLHSALKKLEAKRMTANEYAVYYLRSIEFCKNQM